MSRLDQRKRVSFVFASNSLHSRYWCCPFQKTIWRNPFHRWLLKEPVPEPSIERTFQTRLLKGLFPDPIAEGIISRSDCWRNSFQIWLLKELFPESAAEENLSRAGCWRNFPKPAAEGTHYRSGCWRNYFQNLLLKNSFQSRLLKKLFPYSAIKWTLSRSGCWRNFPDPTTEGTHSRADCWWS
jgi:hypothetical protein